MILSPVLMAQDLEYPNMRLGLINDTDGYVNIRSGKGVNFEIVDKILNNELFFFLDSTDQNWCYVSTIKFNYLSKTMLAESVTGYISKSRIAELNKLDKEKVHLVYSEIFQSEIKFFREITNNSKNSSTFNPVFFHEYQFDGSLNSLTDFICKSKDYKLLSKYLRVMEVELGLADESPSTALGEIFFREPDWSYTFIFMHPYLIDSFEFGLGNDLSSKSQVVKDSIIEKYNDLRLSSGLPPTEFNFTE